MNDRERQIIGLIHREVKPALGCTEPIAVALAVAKAIEILQADSDLDRLKAELEEIKAIPVERTREQRLRAFQDKIASLTFLEKTLPTLIQTNETKKSTQIDAFFESKPKIDAFLKIDANGHRKEYKKAS